MINNALVPSPQTTVVILLGASEWPNYPEFHSSKAFLHACENFRAYLLSPQYFALPPENLLDLFNSPKGVDEQDEEIGRFLEQRSTALRANNQTVRDIIFYFVGHAGFVDNGSDLFLAVRRSRQDNPRVSGLEISELAYTLREKARHVRRLLILDCCFAAAAFRAFQADPAHVALVKTINAFEVKRRGSGFPAKGTTLLCSSDHQTPSLLLPDESSTMFTQALVQALMQGVSSQQAKWSLREVQALTADILHDIAPTTAPRPVVHSPDQSEGDIGEIPFFPNPAYRRVHTRQQPLPSPHPTPVAQPVKKIVPDQILSPGVLSSPPMQTPAQAAVTPLITPPLTSHTLPPRRSASSPNRQVTPSGMPLAKAHAPVPTPNLGLSKGYRVLLLTLALLLIGGGSYAYSVVSTSHTQVPAKAVISRDTTATSRVSLTATAMTSRDATATIRASQTKTVKDAINAYDARVATYGIMFGFDAQHTNTNSYEHILNVANVSQLHQAWTASTSARYGSSLVVANGLVYVGSGEHIYAFDAGTGKQKWASLTGGNNDDSPAVANGLVYIGSQDYKLYAFDATTGEQKWASLTDGTIRSSPTVANGLVYAGSGDGSTLYAFDAATGEQKWTASTGGSFESSPAVGNGLVYAGSVGNKLYAFDAATGGQKWVAIVSDFIGSSPAVANGLAYIGSGTGDLYAFDATTGEQKWTAPTHGGIYSSPAFPAVANGLVYVGSDKLYAFDATTGKQKWAAPTGNATNSSPVVANGLVYVGSVDDKLYAFSLS